MLLFSLVNTLILCQLTKSFDDLEDYLSPNENPEDVIENDYESVTKPITEKSKLPELPFKINPITEKPNLTELPIKISTPKLTETRYNSRDELKDIIVLYTTLIKKEITTQFFEQQKEIKNVTEILRFQNEQINYFKKKIFDIASIMDKLRENFQIKNYQLDLAIKELNRTKEFMLKTSTDKIALKQIYEIVEKLSIDIGKIRFELKEIKKQDVCAEKLDSIEMMRRNLSKEYIQMNVTEELRVANACTKSLKLTLLCVDASVQDRRTPIDDTTDVFDSVANVDSPDVNGIEDSDHSRLYDYETLGALVPSNSSIHDLDDDENNFTSVPTPGNDDIVLGMQSEDTINWVKANQSLIPMQPLLDDGWNFEGTLESNNTYEEDNDPSSDIKPFLLDEIIDDVETKPDHFEGTFSEFWNMSKLFPVIDVNDIPEYTENEESQEDPSKGQLIFIGIAELKDLFQQQQKEIVKAMKETQKTFINETWNSQIKFSFKEWKEYLVISIMSFTIGCSLMCSVFWNIQFNRQQKTEHQQELPRCLSQPNINF